VYIRQCAPQGPARGLFEDARPDIMVQAPELDEMVQWSSVVAGDR
jgi:hypothetical protein